MNATEILLKQVLKSLGVDPETFAKLTGETVQTVLQLKTQLDRIEETQLRILAHLEMSPVPPAPEAILTIEGNSP